MFYDTKKEAQEAGESLYRRLSKYMSLDGVKIDVTNNIKWYVTLRHKHFGIYIHGYSGKLEYSVLVAPNGYGCGRLGWDSFPSHAKTVGDIPDLLKSVMKKAHAEIDELTECANTIDGLLDKPLPFG